MGVVSRRRASKSLAAVVAWVSLAGASTTVAEVSAQVERPFVFYRVCNIEPGQDDAAVALAQDMVDIASKKYPAAEMSVTIGRWMTGFQNVSDPVDQIRFSEQHPDLATHQDFTDLLQADEDFLVLQERTRGLIDVSSCVESRFRARP